MAFLVLSVGLLTAPAVTATSYGFPSAGNSDSIAEDGKKIKEKVKEKVKETKDKVEKKAAEAKKKWEKKKDGGSDDNDSGGNDSGDSDDSSEGSDNSDSDESSDSSDAGDDSSDESEQDDSSEESSEESEEAVEEETEEEVVEEEVEETVEEPEEEVVEETVEEPVEKYPEGTFPDSHFVDRPLERFQLQKYHITDPYGNRLMSVRSGEEVEIDYSFRNIQQKEQTYVMIAQIIDQQGVTIDMGWYIDTIQSGEYADWYGFWTPETPGTCTIKIMVWDSVDENPAPITKITEMTILVH